MAYAGKERIKEIQDILKRNAGDFPQSSELHELYLTNPLNKAAFVLNAFLSQDQKAVDLISSLNIYVYPFQFGSLLPLENPLSLKQLQFIIKNSFLIWGIQRTQEIMTIFDAYYPEALPGFLEAKSLFILQAHYSSRSFYEKALNDILSSLSPEERIEFANHLWKFSLDEIYQDKRAQFWEAIFRISPDFITYERLDYLTRNAFTTQALQDNNFYIPSERWQDIFNLALMMGNEMLVKHFYTRCMPHFSAPTSLNGKIRCLINNIGKPWFKDLCSKFDSPELRENLLNVQKVGLTPFIEAGMDFPIDQIRTNNVDYIKHLLSRLPHYKTDKRVRDLIFARINELSDFDIFVLKRDSLTYGGVPIEMLASYLTPARRAEHYQYLIDHKHHDVMNVKLIDSIANLSNHQYQAEFDKDPKVFYKLGILTKYKLGSFNVVHSNFQQALFEIFDRQIKSKVNEDLLLQLALMTYAMDAQYDKQMAAIDLLFWLIDSAATIEGLTYLAQKHRDALTMNSRIKEFYAACGAKFWFKPSTTKGALIQKMYQSLYPLASSTATDSAAEFSKPQPELTQGDDIIPAPSAPYLDECPASKTPDAIAKKCEPSAPPMIPETPTAVFYGAGGTPADLTRSENVASAEPAANENCAPFAQSETTDDPLPINHGTGNSSTTRPLSLTSVAIPSTGFPTIENHETPESHETSGDPEPVDRVITEIVTTAECNEPSASSTTNVPIATEQSARQEDAETFDQAAFNALFPDAPTHAIVAPVMATMNRQSESGELDATHRAAMPG